MRAKPNLFYIFICTKIENWPPHLVNVKKFNNPLFPFSGFLKQMQPFNNGTLKVLLMVSFIFSTCPVVVIKRLPLSSLQGGEPN